MAGTGRSGRRSDSPDVLTIDDLVAMPHLGLELVAGASGRKTPVVWTHVSELEDPGPWLEGGELLIVNGLGIPADAAGQVSYIERLARHRLAGLAVSVRGPEMTRAMLDEADARSFPVLKIPRQVPFVELSHLVANASERSARSRLERHLRIFDMLRVRNNSTGSMAEIYTKLEQISGYRLALLSPAGRPLSAQWDWLPEDLDFSQVIDATDLRVIRNGYVLPLYVDGRVTAFLVGLEREGLQPGGLASLQHVSSLAALDAIDDQRRREVVHRQSSAVFARALDGNIPATAVEERLEELSGRRTSDVRCIALKSEKHGAEDIELRVRDWLTDHDIAHLLLMQDALLAVVDLDESGLLDMARRLRLHIGVSERRENTDDLGRLQRQALWALSASTEVRSERVIYAERRAGLVRWLNSDIELLSNLADDVLRSVLEYDRTHGSELARTLAVYFQHDGRLRPAAAELFVHDHTLSYRLRRIEQLTGKNLRTLRDAFELWLAIEVRSMRF